MPEFYMIFARKMPEFFIIIAGKIFFPNFRGRDVPPPLPRLLRLCTDDWCHAIIVPWVMTIGNHGGARGAGRWWMAA